MGGRGGRGGARKGPSFNIEALGLVKGEPIPGPCLQPAPDYPILEHHPTPLTYTSTSLVQLSFKVDMLNHLSREVKCLNYHWDYFPYELRPGVKKRRASTSCQPGPAPKAKTTDISNIDQLLAHLEKNETAQVKVEVEEKEGDEEVPEEEFDETDEEMDDGTDYNQNYFDNGEGYLETDDDNDDGPTY